jgi:hypothetical protein
MAAARSHEKAKEEIKEGMAEAGRAAARDRRQRTDQPPRRSMREQVPAAERLSGGAEDRSISRRAGEAVKES